MARHVLVAALLLCGHPVPNFADTGALPPETGAFFQRLLPPSELTRHLDIAIDHDRVRYRFRRGEAVAEIELAHPTTCAAPDGPMCVSRTRASGQGGEQLMTEASAAVVAALRRSESGPGWVTHERPPPPRWLLIGETFFLVLLGGVLVAVWRLRRSIAGPDALPVALLTALAIAVRFIAHAGPSDIRPVLDPEVGFARAGWVALVQLVYEVLPRVDETIWNVNRLAGALTVPLLFVVMKRRFADPLSGMAGAAALAVTPLIVRFSASDTPYVLLCAAFFGALVAWDRYVESPSLGALLLALGLFTAAIQLRPDGVWLVVPAALLLLCGPLGTSVRRLRPLLLLTCLVSFVAVNAVPVLWAVRSHAGGGYLQQFVLVPSLYGSPFADAGMTPRSLALLVGVGAVAAVFAGRPGWLWLAATIVADPLDFPAHSADSAFGHYANARYYIPAVYLACGLVGVGVAALLRPFAWQGWLGWSRTRGIVAGVALVCAAALPGRDLLWLMWTPQREYEIFRTGLRGIGETCDVVTLADSKDAGWTPFEYLTNGRLVDITEFLAAPADDRCVVYYRCGNCYTLDLVTPEERSGFTMNPVCRAIEERFDLAPIVETDVPALPYRGETYARPSLPLGFFRLEPKRASRAPRARAPRVEAAADAVLDQKAPHGSR